MDKYSSLILLFLVFILTACKSEQQRLQEAIEFYEVQTEEDPNVGIANELIALYQNYTRQFPEDKGLNARYLYRAAGVEYRLGDPEDALELLKQLLVDYSDSEIFDQAATFMGKIQQEDLRNPETAISIFQALDRKNNQQGGWEPKAPQNLPAVEDRLNSLNKEVFNDSISFINYKKANEFILSCEAYALVLPQSEKAPEYLFKAAQVAQAIQTFQKSIDLLQTINTRYPKSNYDAQAMFLKAFLLDDGLKNFEEARIAYEAFIEKYPNDPFADDAEMSLKMLGTDINELIDSFSRQAQ